MSANKEKTDSIANIQQTELFEPFAFMWEEVWKDADTQDGPGDYCTELCFDTDPPIEGTQFTKLFTEEQVRRMLAALLNK